MIKIMQIENIEGTKFSKDGLPRVLIWKGVALTWTRQNRVPVIRTVTSVNVQLWMRLNFERKSSTKLLERQLNPCLCKQLIVARLDDKTNDSKCKMADRAVQTDIYLYTKSIKTTTIVRVHGRKKIMLRGRRCWRSSAYRNVNFNLLFVLTV